MLDHLKKIYSSTYPLPPIPTDDYSEWVEGLGLDSEGLASAEVLKIGCDYLAACTNPSQDQATVRLVADLLTFLFVFDDIFGEFSGSENGQTDIYRNFLAVISELDVPPNAHPLQVALLDISRRVAACYDRMDRFYDAMANYFEGCLFEGKFRREQSIPEISDYLVMREKCIGLYPVLILLEVGQPISDSVYQDPRFIRMKQIATLIISAVNDLFSLTKEEKQEELSNFVFVFEAQGFSRATAIEKTLEIHDKLMEEFQSLAATTEFSSDPQIRKYASGLFDWMQGNYRWSLTTLRYKQHNLSPSESSPKIESASSGKVQ